MILAIENPMLEILDRPWRIGGQVVPWFSSQIAVMVLAAVILVLVLVPLTRRRTRQGRGGWGFLPEVIVSFIENNITAPAMGQAGRAYVPMVATLFCYLLTLNLLGLLPLIPLSEVLGLHDTPIGGTPTGSIFVCGALAIMSFCLVLAMGYVKVVRGLWRGCEHGAHDQQHERPKLGINVILHAFHAIESRRWPLPVAAVLGVPVWLNTFVPPMPGAVGLLLWPVLLALELIGLVARCFALCIRLFANMTAGHLLVAVLLLMTAGGTGWALLYGSLPAALGTVAILMLETLTAVVQAYIFTILTTVFIGLAVSPQH